jgi:hypothetical protein
MKKIIILIMSISIFLTLNATENIEDNTADGIGSFNDTVTEEESTKLKAPLLNLFETTQWDLFFREFYMKMEIAWCCSDRNPVDTSEALLRTGSGDKECAVGFKAHMIEPVGYLETSNKPLLFPFSDIDLGGNIVKGSSLYQQVENSAGMRTVAYDSHFIFIPIMGIIFKKNLKFVCFHKGDLVIPYMSEFDPTWKQDIYYAKMIPHMTALFTPQGLLSSIFDCLATEVANAILGWQDGFGNPDISFESAESKSYHSHVENSNPPSEFEQGSLDKMNSIRDTMYFVAGCSGFTPVGGYVNGDDPVLDADLLFHGIMGLLHGASALSPVEFLNKQSNIHINSSSFPRSSPELNVLDTMCTWRRYALPIASQYLLQLSYPTVGSAKEGGSSGASVSTAKAVPGSKGAVYTVWDRRDYYAFAYFCGDDEEGDD